tara:strand:- start:129 stop:428 length:300 start_codon:yes stop_codon:yes gene_type:complete
MAYSKKPMKKKSNKKATGKRSKLDANKNGRIDKEDFKILRSKKKKSSVAKKSLTKRQEETMKKHSKHHSRKHMNFMRKEMLKGKTFGQAHKLALKSIGK